MANFIDEKTGEEFTIPNHRLVHRGGKWVNIDIKTKEILTNPQTGNFLIPIPKEGVPEFLKSNDKATRVKMLKDRSKQHFKKEVTERKYEMNKKLIKKFEDK